MYISDDWTKGIILPDDWTKGIIIPDDWTKGIIIKLAKKGALSDCNNWRGITLLSISSKIMAKIIIQRITDAIDKQLERSKQYFVKKEDA